MTRAPERRRGQIVSGVGYWTMIALPLAVYWAKRHEVARHRRTMMGLFYGGFAINILIAFVPGRTLWMLVFG